MSDELHPFCSRHMPKGTFAKCADCAAARKTHHAALMSSLGIVPGTPVARDGERVLPTDVDGDEAVGLELEPSDDGMPELLGRPLEVSDRVTPFGVGPVASQHEAGPGVVDRDAHDQNVADTQIERDRQLDRSENAAVRTLNERLDDLEVDQASIAAELDRLRIRTADLDDRVAQIAANRAEIEAAIEQLLAAGLNREKPTFEETDRQEQDPDDAVRVGQAITGALREYVANGGQGLAGDHVVLTDQPKHVVDVVHDSPSVGGPEVGASDLAVTPTVGDTPDTGAPPSPVSGDAHSDDARCAPNRGRVAFTAAEEGLIERAVRRELVSDHIQHEIQRRVQAARAAAPQGGAQ